MPPRSTATAVRIAIFYAAFFTVIGTIQPFWPLWLAERGLSADEIGAALAIGVAVKLVGLPVAAHVADRRGERRRPMLTLSAASTLAFTLFALTSSFWPIVLVSLAFFSLWPPVMSLGESLTMTAVREQGLQYGRVRLWGSLGYIATALAAGSVLAHVPAGGVFWMVLAGVAVTTAACVALPDIREARSRSRRLPVLDTLAQRSFVRMLIACGLIQGSHAVYYAFATLHWRAIGYSETVIGGLWAEGVLCEVLLFAFGDRAVRACGARGLIVLAGFAAAVRWLGTAFDLPLPLLVSLQSLHAASFGAAHLGAMHWMAHRIAPGLSATAQSLYSAVVFGLFLGGALWLAGLLYTGFAALAWLPMAAIAFAGGVCGLRLPAGERGRGGGAEA